MKETTPYFALSKQFLVWMAEKFHTYYDLNLVLTEYYKKRLRSQLKNKKMYTKAPILTKSNELTRLQLLTD